MSSSAAAAASEEVQEPQPMSVSEQVRGGGDDGAAGGAGGERPKMIYVPRQVMAVLEAAHAVQTERAERVNPSMVPNCIRLELIGLSGKRLHLPEENEVGFLVSPEQAPMELYMRLATLPETCCETEFELVLEHGSDKVPIDPQQFEQWGHIKHIVSAPFIEHDERFGTPPPNNVVRMVPRRYSANAALAHVRRLRQVLSTPPMRLDLQRLSQATEGGYTPSATSEATPARWLEFGCESVVAAKRQYGDEVYATIKERLEREAAAALDFGDAPKQSSSSGARFSAPPSKQRSMQDLLAEGVNGLAQDLFLGSRPAPSHSPCVERVHWSRWNPPPGPQRMRGDLFYLEVVTLEGNCLTITATPRGFFLNRSTPDKFDPRPSLAPYASHSLVTLLKQASPKFAGRFGALFSGSNANHPTHLNEELPLGSLAFSGSASAPSHQWLRDPTQAAQQPDLARGEDFVTRPEGFLAPDENPITGSWSQELHMLLKTPYNSNTELLMRDAQVVAQLERFYELATQGARAIVEGRLFPFDALDENVFYNPSTRIFFEKVADVTGLYSNLGGVETVHKQMNERLRGYGVLRDLNLPEIDGIVATIVTFRGHRLLCQSPAPGLLDDPQPTPLYGSLNAGTTVASDEAVHNCEGIQTMARKLHMAERNVVTEDGESVPIFSNFQLKVMRGADRSLYILDAVTAPRDANFPDPATHLSATVRHELVSTFCRHAALGVVEEESLKKKIAEKEAAEAAEAAAADGADQDATEAPAAEAAEAANSEETPAADDANDADNTEGMDPVTKLYVDEVDSIRFNHNALTSVKLGGSEEEQAADLEQLQKLASFITETAIPSMLQDVRELAAMPQDSVSLTQLFHERGVNMRYLGQVAALAKDLQLNFMYELCVEEMILRCAKHLLNARLREADPSNPARAQAETTWSSNDAIPFDDSELFVATAAVADREADLYPRISLAASPDDVPTPSNFSVPTLVAAFLNSMLSRSYAHSVRFWRDMAAHVQRRFSFTLDVEQYSPSDDARLRMLRGLCLKVGIQLRTPVLAPEVLEAAAKFGSLNATALSTENAAAHSPFGDYDFNKMPTFTSHDVVDMFPVVKRTPYRSSTLETFLNECRMRLMRGDTFRAASGLEEANHLMSQVYNTPVNADVAHTEQELAMCFYHLNMPARAVGAEQAALISIERCIGRDSVAAAESHSRLSMYLYGTRDYEHAMLHAKRAAFIAQRTSGKNSPLSAGCHLNIAAILLATGRPDTAYLHARTGLELAIQALGSQHPIISDFVDMEAHALGALGYLERCKNKLVLAQRFVEEFRGGKDGESAKHFHGRLAEVASIMLKAKTENRNLTFNHFRTSRGSVLPPVWFVTATRTRFQDLACQLVESAQSQAEEKRKVEQVREMLERQRDEVRKQSGISEERLQDLIGKVQPVVQQELPTFVHVDNSKTKSGKSGKSDKNADADADGQQQQEEHLSSAMKSKRRNKKRRAKRRAAKKRAAQQQQQQQQQQQPNGQANGTQS